MSVRFRPPAPANKPTVISWLHRSLLGTAKGLFYAKIDDYVQGIYHHNSAVNFVVNKIFDKFAKVSISEHNLCPDLKFTMF